MGRRYPPATSTLELLFMEGGKGYKPGDWKSHLHLCEDDMLYYMARAREARTRHAKCQWVYHARFANRAVRATLRILSTL